MTNDTENFGPLKHLIGTWKGEKGMDVAPEKPNGKEENPYHEILKIEAVGDVTNAGEQTLWVLRYHQSVFHKDTQEQFHDEVGYWMWNSDNQTVMQSLQIPRAVGLLAGGKVTENTKGITFEVSAGINNSDFGIIQSPFMQGKAKTEHFKHTVTVKGDDMTYSETTILHIYGKRFEHTDANTLTKTE